MEITWGFLRTFTLPSRGNCRQLVTILPNQLLQIISSFETSWGLAWMASTHLDMLHRWVCSRKSRIVDIVQMCVALWRLSGGSVCRLFKDRKRLITSPCALYNNRQQSIGIAMIKSLQENLAYLRLLRRISTDFHADVISRFCFSFEMLVLQIS